MTQVSSYHFRIYNPTEFEDFTILAPDSVGCLVVCMDGDDASHQVGMRNSITFCLESDLLASNYLQDYMTFGDFNCIDIIFYQKPELKVDIKTEADAYTAEVPKNTGSVGSRLVEFAKREGLFSHMVGPDRRLESN